MHSTTSRYLSLRSLGLALLLSFTVFAGPVQADDSGSPRWTVRANVAPVFSAGDTLTVTEPRFDVTTSDGTAVGLDIEYRWGRYGLELASLAGSFDNELRFPGVAPETQSQDFTSFSLGPNFYLSSFGRTKFHVGAFVAIVAYQDLEFRNGLAEPLILRSDDDLGFGLKGGLDLPLGASGDWVFSTSLRYTDVIIEGEIGGQDFDFSPLIVSVGVGRRF